MGLSHIHVSLFPSHLSTLSKNERGKITSKRKTRGDSHLLKAIRGKKRVKTRTDMSRPPRKLF